jgi:predicted dehydrogenase
MKTAIVGCGYVAEQYGATLASHPDIELIGAYDCNRVNLDVFAKRWPVRKYESLDELLADGGVELVLNLTNPRSHFEINGRALEAGKHVYSEKPLAMTPGEAETLAGLAARLNRYLASAPCSVLSETAQSLWRAIRTGEVGRVRLVYANFDDGMIAPNMAPWTWTNNIGVPWPAKDEFEVGCTYEHAGYLLTWLCAFFGPVQRVTAFASVLLPDKGLTVDRMAPDFSVGVLEFGDGVTARVTCGLVAPFDKSIRIVGDQGTLFVGNVRNDAAPVMLQSSAPPRWQAALVRRTRIMQRWLEERGALSSADALFARTYPLARPRSGGVVSAQKPVDFLRGPSELVQAIAEGRPCRLAADLGVHIVEIIEVLQYPERFNHHKALTTTFAPMAPLEWAR